LNYGGRGSEYNILRHAQHEQNLKKTDIFATIFAYESRRKSVIGTHIEALGGEQSDSPQDAKNCSMGCRLGIHKSCHYSRAFGSRLPILTTVSWPSVGQLQASSRSLE